MKKNITSNFVAIILGVVEFVLLSNLYDEKVGGYLIRSRTGGWVGLPILGTIFILVGNYLNYHRASSDFKGYLLLFIGWFSLIIVTPVLLIIFYSL
jgi:hypothetical protein